MTFASKVFSCSLSAECVSLFLWSGATLFLEHAFEVVAVLFIARTLDRARDLCGLRSRSYAHRLYNRGHLCGAPPPVIC